MSSSNFVQHGQELVDSKRYQEAVKVCRLGLLANPTAIAGRLVLGTALMSLRRYDEVLAEMRVALEIDGTNPRALTLKGEALLHKGDAVQAAHVLNQARAYAPDDRKLLDLCSKADIKLGSSDLGDFSDMDPGSMTKHYPAQIGGSDDDDAHSITRPRSPREARQAYRDNDVGTSGRSTMDIDPHIEGYELIDEQELLDIDPSDSMEMTRALDTNAMGGRARLPIAELDDSIGPLASPPISDDDLTSEHRKAPDHLRMADMRSNDFQPAESEPTNERMTYNRFSARALMNTNAAEAMFQEMQSPSALARKAAQMHTARVQITDEIQGSPPSPEPLPGRRGNDGMPPLHELFPENDAGVSKLLLVPEVPQPPPGSAPVPAPHTAPPSPNVEQAVKQIRSPNQPTLAITSAERMNAGVGAPLGDDMERLRQFAQESANNDSPILASIVEVDMPNFMPGAPLPSQPPVAAPMQQTIQAPSAPMHLQPMRNRPVPSQPPLSQPPVSMTASMPKKRSPLTYLMYVTIALGVVAGGVFAGFKIREIRLDRQIRSAERDAVEYARIDTFDGYTRARAAYERIVSVRDNDRTKSSIARMNAALAYEFGDSLDQARSMTRKLSDANNVDIMVARAYLALERADIDAAAALARDIEKDYPNEPLGPYLVGRVALLSGQAKDAIAAFERGLKIDRRPLMYVGLAQAYLAGGNDIDARSTLTKALDFDEGHPQALLDQTRIITVSGSVPDDVTTIVKALEGIIRDSDNDTPRASPRQQAQAAIALSKLELLRGRNTEARKALDRVADIMPRDDREFSIEYIQALWRAGVLDAVVAETERALKRWPKDLSIRIAAADVALDSDDPQKALERLNEQGINISENARALTSRGRAYYAMGNQDKAKSDLDRALELSPTSTAAHVARADLDLDSGRADDAVKRLEVVYKDDAPTAIAIVYGAALREVGERKKAREILETQIKRPNSGRAHLELARLEVADARFPKAREAYASAVLAFAGKPEVKLEAALLDLETGDIKTAVQNLSSLAGEAPKNPRVLLEAARVYTLTGQFSEAEELLDTANGLPGTPRWQLVREQARLHWRKGAPHEALRELENAVLNFRDEDTEIWLMMLNVQLFLEKDTDARQTKARIFKVFPLNAPIRDMARARLASYDDRLKEALAGYRSARRALKKKRATPRQLGNIAYWTGRAQYAADQLPAARKSFAKAIDLDPGLADAHMYLGLVDFNLEKWSKAESEFKRALTIDPTGTPVARYYYAESVFNQKRRKDARRAFESYLELFPDGSFAPDAKAFLKQ